MGLFRGAKSRSPLIVDWLGVEPANGDDIKRLAIQTTSAIERGDYEATAAYSYVELLPEGRALKPADLLAFGPATIHLSGRDVDASAFVTTTALVLLHQQSGLNEVLVLPYVNLAAFQVLDQLGAKFEWNLPDGRAFTFGLSPAFGRDGTLNRRALEWCYTLASLIEQLEGFGRVEPR